MLGKQQGPVATGLCHQGASGDGAALQLQQHSARERGNKQESVKQVQLAKHKIQLLMWLLKFMIHDAQCAASYAGGGGSPTQAWSSGQVRTCRTCKTMQDVCTMPRALHTCTCCGDLFCHLGLLCAGQRSVHDAQCYFDFKFCLLL